MSILFVITLMICSTAANGCKSIFLLAGQSNMSGRGGVSTNGTWDGVVPPECQANPLISRFNASTLKWEEAQEPLHKGVDFAGTVGVGSGIVDTLRHYFSGEVSLYRGDWVGPLCQRCNKIEPATLYKARFEQFVQDIRSDLRAALLPVIEVAITSGGRPELREILRQGQFQSARELAEVRCVDAKGLSRKPDDPDHITTEAQVKLRKMMADAYLNMSLPLPCF